MSTPVTFDDLSQPIVWLDFDAYANQVFAGRHAGWLRTAATRIGALERAQSAVSSDVVIFDVAAPFLAAGLPRSELFRDEGASAYLDTLCAAAGHRLARKASIVLSIPSPRDLLIATGLAADQVAGFDECDDVAMAACDLLRRLSEKTVSWLNLRFSDRDKVGDDELDAIQPLVRAARHYGWSVALEFPAITQPDRAFAGALEADCYLYPDAAGPSTDPRVLSGVSPTWWSGALEGDPPDRFCGGVPTEIAPELLLRRFAMIGVATAAQGGNAA